MTPSGIEPAACSAVPQPTASPRAPTDCDGIAEKYTRNTWVNPQPGMLTQNIQTARQSLYSSLRALGCFRLQRNAVYIYLRRSLRKALL